MISRRYRIWKEVINMESLVQVLVYLFSTEIVKPIFSTVLATIIGNLMKGKEIPMTEERRKRLENKRKIYKKLYYQFCVDLLLQKHIYFMKQKKKFLISSIMNIRGTNFYMICFQLKFSKCFGSL